MWRVELLQSRKDWDERKNKNKGENSVMSLKVILLVRGFGRNWVGKMDGE
jgi:hypothetical protein